MMPGRCSPVGGRDKKEVQYRTINKDNTGRTVEENG